MLGAYFLEVDNIKFKRIIAVIITAFFCLQTTSFASTGDPNIDNGGGGLQSGQTGNFWYSGDDGVRATIVDSQTGEVKSESVDYTNKHPDDIAVHFGKVSKAEYTAGKSLSVSTGKYKYKDPAQPLPLIVSNGDYSTDIEKIRSYFTDEQVVRGISNHVGIPFNELTNGDYKLMIEPVVYITYNGIRTAMTATEAALYNMQTGGDLSRKFGPLSHKNLPLAMFLEKDDLGYKAWTGSTTSRATDSDILKYLGVGIVSFKETSPPEPEISAGESDYRVDTDVYTSVTVTGGEHTPDNPVTVRFYIKNKVYTVGNVVFPKGDSQLVWCKWHTPKTEQTVNIRVAVSGAQADKTNITANIVDLDKNPPPDPTAYDRNDDFKTPNVPNKVQRTSAA